MKKVLFINSNKAWGGGEKWHYNMALALREEGYNVMLICSPHSELAKAATNSNLEISYLNIKNLSFLNPIKLIKAYKILKTFTPNSIILNLPSDAKLTSVLSLLQPLKNIIYRRGMPHPFKNNFLNRFVFSRVNIFIANSLEIKKSIIKNLPYLEPKVKVIYNGVYPKSIEPSLFGKTIRLGNLGRLVDQKGQFHLIDVAKSLSEINFDFKLSIAGVGPNKEKLKKLIKDNKLENHISLLGHVEPNSFFEQIDLFLFTSYFEGSANALIESLQYNIPAIAFNISSNPEVIEDKVNGYLVKPYSSREMTDKIIEIYNLKEDYLGMRKQAQNTILKKFNYSQKIQEVKDILNNEN